MVDLEDWVNFAEFEQTHFVDTENSLSGPAALRTPKLDEADEATVYNPSLDASGASKKGRIETAIRRTQDAYIGVYTRFVDEQNYYFILGGRFFGPEDELRMYRTESGKTKLISRVYFQTFSDGTRINQSEPSWIPFRITWFTDDLNGYRIWVQEDANGDGEWEDVGGTLVDPDPILGPDALTTGSGIGFGSIGTIHGDFEGNDGVWYDNTDLFYPQ